MMARRRVHSDGVALPVPGQQDVSTQWAMINNPHAVLPNLPPAPIA
ncbi:hypothetical protein ASAP_2314 [Asaia bogorensis]|uniref:Uncharacterized protein n=1 Tax=Asaia bogorensis TaxID=91915 RepID=A0A060QGU4_9PROT|nr:hypothetical protein ASAP_2314 [Asaia bogorensis]